MANGAYQNRSWRRSFLERSVCSNCRNIRGDSALSSTSSRDTSHNFARRGPLGADRNLYSVAFCWCGPERAVEFVRYAPVNAGGVVRDRASLFGIRCADGFWFAVSGATNSWL